MHLLQIALSYGGGAINIHIYRDVLSWIMGMTASPFIIFRKDSGELVEGLYMSMYDLLEHGSDFVSNSSIKTLEEYYSELMFNFAMTPRYYMIYGASIFSRVKGFFVKAVKFVKNKVLPIFKRVAPLVSPFIPGLTPILVGINALDKTPAVTSTINCAAVAKTNALGSFKDSTGDYFKLTMQVRLCELDSNDEPIYIDTIANNDYQW